MNLCKRCNEPITDGQGQRYHFDGCEHATERECRESIRARLAEAEKDRDRAVAAAMVAQSHTEESLRVAKEYRARLAEESVEHEQLVEIMHWTQAAVTALAVGGIRSGSPLHHKLRDVMIAYRAAKEGQDEQS